MNKGICFHFGYVYKDIEEQAKAIKAAGFDSVIANADPSFDKENGKIGKQVKLFRKYGLKLSSLHMRYKREHLPHFWHNGFYGNKLEKDIIKDLKIAKKYGFTCVVVHLRGEPNEVGYNRLRRILKVCEKLDVPIALENIGDQHCLERTFQHVESKYLKFCFDSGHNHAFEQDRDYIGEYGKQLVALHLHDNLGMNPDQNRLVGLTAKKPSLDMHTLNKYGNIDWKEIAKRLAKVNHEISLDYEVMMVYRGQEMAEEVLREVYKQACELEQMIESYKKG